jgi:hypothetical protein
MDDVIALLKSIPSSFWGVLAGSIFSLAGVVLSNRHNIKRLRIQFENDREIRRIDRERAMFQAIYLAAAETIGERLTAIIRLSNLDISDDSIAPNTNGALAKAEIVADEITRKALAEIGTSLTSAYLKLSLKRNTVKAIAIKGKVWDDQISDRVQKQSRTTELMRQYNLDLKTNKREWEVLQTNFDFETQQLDKALEEKHEITLTLQRENYKLVEEAFEEYAKLLQPTIAAIVALRRALELETDEEAIAHVFTKEFSEQRQLVSEYLKKSQNQSEQFLQSAFDKTDKD